MSVRKPYHIIMGGSQNKTDGTKATKCHPGCAFHLAVYWRCYELLTDPTRKEFFFRKDEVLKSLKLNKISIDISLLEIKIYWDYVVRHLQEEKGMELIGVNELFFTDYKQQLLNEQENPTLTKETQKFDGANEMNIASRAISRGAGRKTVGYTSFEAVAGALRVAKIQYKEKLVAGLRESLDGTKRRAKEIGPTTVSGMLAAREREKQKMLK